jgi:hypothetical protein
MIVGRRRWWRRAEELRWRNEGFGRIGGDIVLSS